MEELKQDPKSLAVSDLQLLIAFFMRNDIDLTDHLKEVEGGYLIEYTPNEDYKIIGKDLKLTAKFNKDGHTLFCKVEKSFPDGYIQVSNCMPPVKCV